MTNKPMLSVERELLESCWAALMQKGQVIKALELRALLDKPAKDYVLINGMHFSHAEILEWREKACADMEKAAQHQGEPVAQSEFEPDAICLESDGCPTEGAVLKRFWRENQPDTELCKFYEAEDCQSLVKELVGHVAQLQDAAKRNVKPWEDTFPPTLLPAYIARINAEKPAPVVVVMPERQIVPDNLMAGLTRKWCEGWNDALEEVARLNGVKP